MKTLTKIIYQGLYMLTARGRRVAASTNRTHLQRFGLVRLAAAPPRRATTLLLDRRCALDEVRPRLPSCPEVKQPHSLMRQQWGAIHWQLAHRR